MADVQEITLSVPDMSCAHCVQTINKTVGQLQGVEEVEARLGQKQVYIRYQPENVSVAQIATALDDAGYTVVEQG